MSAELPELQEGLLDDATLRTLLADLRDHATVLDVLVKGGPSELATLGENDPTRVPELLRGGVRGVQVRYAFDGAEWRDTLMPAPGGVRLVRMKIDFDP
ncbi:MAG: hypothetical protein KC621_31045 [Myxococcales bacterium]|nr:hypothetical protein [Myxococcales bacterium]